VLAEYGFDKMETAGGRRSSSGQAPRIVTSGNRMVLRLPHAAMQKSAEVSLYTLDGSCLFHVCIQVHESEVTVPPEKLKMLSAQTCIVRIRTDGSEWMLKYPRIK
jgi:hypothetical protein